MKIQKVKMSASTFVFCLCLGLMMSAALLALMSWIVYGKQIPLDQSSVILRSDILMSPRNIESVKKIIKPEKPKLKSIERPSLSKSTFDSNQVVLDMPSIDAPSLRSDFKVSMAQFSMSEGEYLPLVKIAPLYPQRALMQGVEGYAVVEFTVNPDGGVTDAVVLESNPANVFDRAAIRAVLNFKYSPRIVDGVAVAVPHIKNRFVFSLEDEKAEGNKEDKE